MRFSLLYGAVASTALGAFFFISVVNHENVLAFTQVNWIHGDWLRHFTAWEYFRQEPWDGVKIHGLTWPVETSITAMDGIPWLGIIFKSLRSVLPSPFQYLGLWLAICFSLQGLFAFLVFRESLDGFINQLLASVLLIMASPLLFRLGHVGLCSHFLILASVWLYFRSIRKNAFPTLGYGLIFSVAAGIHPYILAMCIPIGLAASWVDCHRPRRELTKMYKPFLSLLGLGLILYLLGYAQISEPWSGGFSGYEADLLAFINPFYVSNWIPEVRGPWGGYEGMAYLGLSSLFLMICAWVGKRFLNHKTENQAKADLIAPLWFVCLLMWVFALSGKICFGGNVILNVERFYKLMDPLPGVFRTSGRFIWPLYYLILISAVFAVDRYFSARRTTILLLCAVLLNFSEYSNWYRSPKFAPADQSLSKKIITILESKPQLNGVITVPPYSQEVYSCDETRFEPDFEAALMAAAAEKNLSVTLGHPGRAPTKLIRNNCQSIMKHVDAREFEDGKMYVFHHELKKNIPPQMKCIERPEASFCTL